MNHNERHANAIAERVELERMDELGRGMMKQQESMQKIGMPGLPIAQLWVGLEEVRQRTAAIKTAAMLKKGDAAEAAAEAVGDLLKKQILVIAGLAARIEKLEGKSHE